MKIAVQETITKHIEIELPLYGEWWDEAGDGGDMWETKFRIGPELQLLTVTEWTGTTTKTEIELHQLTDREVGRYLKYNAVKREDFQKALGEALTKIDSFRGEA